MARFQRFASLSVALVGTGAVLTAMTGSTAMSAPVAAPRTAADHAGPTAVGDVRGATEVGGCPVYPENNYWNTPVTDLPVDSHSDAWLSHMSPDADLHPDFGRSYGEQPVPYGIPITYVDNSHATVQVTFRYGHESDPGPYPLGDDTRIEGGWRGHGDRHALVINTDTCELYETWKTKLVGDRWHAGSGAVWDLRSNHLRPDGWTSADAAGLPVLAGLLRYDEVEVRGQVTHAIRFTTDITQTAHLWPARHDAGSQSGPDFPPMGARFRLKQGFSTAGYRSDTVAVLDAMKRYGMVLADNGSPWYFQGEADKRWPSGLISELKTIPASAFEAVDTSGMEINHNSGRAR
jgi:hypothetical protein